MHSSKKKKEDDDEDVKAEGENVVLHYSWFSLPRIVSLYLYSITGKANDDDGVSPPLEQYWWRGVVNGQNLDDISFGIKLVLLFEILKKCEEIGDKLLVSTDRRRCRDTVSGQS